MKNIIYISILLIQVHFVFGQSLNSHNVDSLIAKYAKEYSIVGLSIGVIYDGAVETNSFGNISYDSEIAIDENTLFNTASITKLFTATAIMQLVEEGKLTLNDKLSDILPEFKMKDKRYTEITIQHLLTHSSGLMWNNKLNKSPDNKSSLPLYLQQLEKKKLAFEPGSKMSYYTYSNVAFDLLGLVIERVSDKTYFDFIEDKQLNKLDLDQSTFEYETIAPSKLALPQIVAGKSKAIKKLNFQGVDRKRNPIINGDPLCLEVHDRIGEDYEHNPSGNLMSSTSELLLWIDEIIKLHNRSDSNSIISHSSLDRMWSKNYLASGDDISIGLAWWIKEDKKYGKSYFHVGTNPGYSSILMIFPEENFGITILSNGWYGKDVVWKKLFYEIVELYIGK